MNGSQIVSEQWDDKLLVFLYDESGSPIGMQYRTNSMAEGTFYTYLFEKNLQGDIIAVYNTSGTKLISYVYDAWGNFRQTNHNISGTNAGAQYNPFTYRGYYCDTELELYYLQSRYYDPFYGRFINADSYLSTGTGLLGYNMYAYCNNNPVMYADPTGEFFLTTTICGIALWKIGLAAAGVLTVAYVEYTLVHNPSNLPSIPILRERSRLNLIPKIKEREKEATLPPTSSSEKTYFHVTTMENAMSIMSTGIMRGSDFEGGYVFAWRIYPNKYAIQNSGAREGSVIIAFETNAAFASDPGIKDPKIRKYLPVRSVFPGSIYVKNVRIVG